MKDTSRFSWTQPICERDWVAQRATWEQLPDGSEKLVSVPVPVRVIDANVERCSWCGEATIMGVFVRADPASVPFPALNED